MDQDGTWRGGRPHHTRLCVRWRPSPLPQKGGRTPSPIFGPFLLWPNGCMHQDATWCEDTPQPRGLCVRWGPSPSAKRGQSPQFLAHVYCGKMAEWIKMALGMEVGLSPGNFVLDGYLVPLTKRVGSSPPQFAAHFYCSQTAGCIKMPLGVEVGLSPGDFVLNGDPAPPSQKGGGAPNFRPMSIAVKRLHGSRCHLVRR